MAFASEISHFLFTCMWTWLFVRIFSVRHLTIPAVFPCGVCNISLEALVVRIVSSCLNKALFWFETEKEPSSSEYSFSSRNWQSLLKYWGLFIYIFLQNACQEHDIRQQCLNQPLRHRWDVTDLPVVELNICSGRTTFPQCLQLCCFDVLAFMTCFFTLHSSILLGQLFRMGRLPCWSSGEDFGSWRKPKIVWPFLQFPTENCEAPHSC